MREGAARGGSRVGRTRNSEPYLAISYLSGVMVTPRSFENVKCYPTLHALCAKYPCSN